MALRLRSRPSEGRPEKKRARPRPVVGVDIGATAIRAVMLAPGSARDRNVEVIRMGARRLDSAVSEGNITQPSQVALNLESVLDDIDAPSGAPLAIAVSGKNTALGWFGLPPSLKLSERMDYIRSNVQRIETLDTKDAALSLVPLGIQAGDDALASVAAVHRDRLRVLERICERVGVTLGVVDLSASALLRASVRPEAQDAMVLVDIGDTHTTVAMRVSTHLRWVETIPKGSRSITAALVGTSDLDESAAELLKQQLVAHELEPGSVDGAEQFATTVASDDAMWGGEVARDNDRGDDDPQARYGPALTVAVDRLMDAIGDVIQNRTRDHKSVRPAGIALAGRGSLVKGMTRRLQERTRLPVHGALPWATFIENEFTRPFMTADPTTNGRKERYVMLPDTELAFAIAIGMAMTPVVR